MKTRKLKIFYIDELNFSGYDDYINKWCVENKAIPFNVSISQFGSLLYIALIYETAK